MGDSALLVRRLQYFGHMVLTSLQPSLCSCCISVDSSSRL